MSKSDNRVHGCTDLVAHVGEEVGFGSRGRLGRILGPPYLTLGPLALGDVFEFPTRMFRPEVFREIDGPSTSKVSPSFGRYRAFEGHNVFLLQPGNQPCSFSTPKSYVDVGYLHSRSSARSNPRLRQAASFDVFEPAIGRPRPEHGVGGVVHGVLCESGLFQKPFGFHVAGQDLGIQGHRW